MPTTILKPVQLFGEVAPSNPEQTLPALIADLRHAATGSDEATALLATAYQTSASLLLKLGDQGNAWLAVGRAMAEVDRSGDPIVLAQTGPDPFRMAFSP